LFFRRPLEECEGKGIVEEEEEEGGESREELVEVESAGEGSAEVKAKQDDMREATEVTKASVRAEKEEEGEEEEGDDDEDDKRKIEESNDASDAPMSCTARAEGKDVRGELSEEKGEGECVERDREEEEVDVDTGSERDGIKEFRDCETARIECVRAGVQTEEGEDGEKGHRRNLAEEEECEDS
jgi:hypothetical protein